jgi:hypothetical protein
MSDQQQMWRAMKAQAALLLARLRRHEAHVSPRDCFENRFCVSRIVLLSLEVRLDVQAASSGPRDRASEITYCREADGEEPHCYLHRRHELRS